MAGHHQKKAALRQGSEPSYGFLRPYSFIHHIMVIRATFKRIFASLPIRDRVWVDGIGHVALILAQLKQTVPHNRAAAVSGGLVLRWSLLIGWLELLPLLLPFLPDFWK